MNRETLIYGLAAGDTKRWQESLLYGGGRLLTPEQVEMVKAAASRDGYHSFRVTTYDGAPPNFAGTVGGKA